jgi:hypothetical protein
MVVFPLVIVAWVYGLLKGVRWVWIVTVAISALGPLPDLVSGTFSWRSAISSLIGIVLLTLPVTRQYFVNQAIAGSAEPEPPKPAESVG